MSKNSKTVLNINSDVKMNNLAKQYLECQEFFGALLQWRLNIGIKHKTNPWDEIINAKTIFMRSFVKNASMPCGLQMKPRSKELINTVDPMIVKAFDLMVHCNLIRWNINGVFHWDEFLTSTVPKEYSIVLLNWIKNSYKTDSDGLFAKELLELSTK